MIHDFLTVVIPLPFRPLLLGGPWFIFPISGEKRHFALEDASVVLQQNSL